MTTRPLAVLLDANVLYPAPVRDILLHLADAGSFLPKWTKEIQDEWTMNLLANRKDLKKSALDKTVAAMNKAFPDANISGYGFLKTQLILPDADDRHVLAAAIKGKVSHIATANIKDFPPSIIRYTGCPSRYIYCAPY